MSIHEPKNRQSIIGLGSPNNFLETKLLHSSLAIVTETWGNMEEPYIESNTILANTGYVWITEWEVGKNYIMTKMFDIKNELVGIYCDISSPVTKTDNVFEMIDWYLDVWQEAGKKPILLDEDELEEALKAGYISEQEAKVAKDTAKFLIDKLDNNSIKF